MPNRNTLIRVYCINYTLPNRNTLTRVYCINYTLPNRNTLTRWYFISYTLPNRNTRLLCSWYGVFPVYGIARYHNSAGWAMLIPVGLWWEASGLTKLRERETQGIVKVSLSVNLDLSTSLTYSNIKLDMPDCRRSRCFQL